MAKISRVKLGATDTKKQFVRSFPIDIANKLLSLSNSKWELKDPNYEWNGKEISKK